MDTNHPNFKSLLKKRHLKAKYNRFNKAGSLALEHINDLSRFSELINILQDLYDFRQGALFNKNQFRSDPKKAAYLKTLFCEGLLHVTTLKFNHKIVAAIISFEDKKWVHLSGLIIHSPFYAKYSPGLVLLYLLGHKFSIDKVDVFDLTPGYDDYKERVATNHDYTYEMSVTNSIIYRWRAVLRKKFHQRILKLGSTPQKLQLQFRKTIYLFTEKYKYGISLSNFVPIQNWFMNQFKKKSADEFLPICPKAANGLFTFQVNNLSDMLSFQQNGSSLTRWEFLENAMKRYEKEQASFSIVRKNELVFCAWMEKPNGNLIDYNGKSVKIPDNSVVITSCYCCSSFAKKSILADLSQFIISEYSVQKVLIVAKHMT